MRSPEGFKDSLEAQMAHWISSSQWTSIRLLVIIKYNTNSYILMPPKREIKRTVIQYTEDDQLINSSKTHQVR